MIEKLRRIVESLGYPFFFGTRDEVYAYINSVRTVVACYRQGGGGRQQFFVFKFKGDKPQRMYEEVMREIKRQFTVGVQRVFFYDDVLEARFPLMAKTYIEGGARPTPHTPDYLKFTAQGPASISMTHGNYGNINVHPDIEISMDGQTWETWNFTLVDGYWVADEISLNDGGTVMMRGDNPNGTGHYYVGEGLYEYFYFVIDGNVASSGDLNCLIDKIGGKETTLAEYCYIGMFQGCTGLTSAPVLPATTLAASCYIGMFKGCTGLTSAPVLPATTLAAYCYSYMFQGCTGLTSAPVLPATTLAEYCYSYMFGDCTGLTSAPVLPATTLADSCYSYMFQGCTGLTSAPVLPATTLAEYCYIGMFFGCTGLTSAPALSATTLAANCYSGMFYGCTGLTSAPVLPATTLADSCYSYMFQGCTGLTSAPVLPATTLADSCYSYMFQGCTGLTSIEVHATMWNTSWTEDWLDNVSATGTFRKPSETTISTGTSGIPSGWTVENF